MARDVSLSRDEARHRSGLSGSSQYSRTGDDCPTRCLAAATLAPQKQAPRQSTHGIIVAAAKTFDERQPVSTHHTSPHSLRDRVATWSRSTHDAIAYPPSASASPPTGSPWQRNQEEDVPRAQVLRPSQHESEGHLVGHVSDPEQQAKGTRAPYATLRSRARRSASLLSGPSDIRRISQIPGEANDQ